MSPLTVFLARFFGLFCLLMCAALAVRPKASVIAVHSLMNSPGLLLVTGICTLAGGVATVIGHNVWQGGALPVVVTVLGWLTLIKGFALMITPPDKLGNFYRVMHEPQRFRIYMGVCTAFSLWLTVAAFMA